MTLNSSLPGKPGTDDTASTGTALDRAGRDQLEVHTMSTMALARAVHYLTNDEAALFLKLSPRTLEKQRVRGDGPRFHKFGRRVVYAIEDLEKWAHERICSSTADGNYIRPHS